MATVTPFIRTTIKSKEVNVRFRLRDGRKVSLFHASEIKVNPDFWDEKRFEIKAKVSELSMSKTAKTNFNKTIQERKAIILDAYQTINGQTNLTSDLLESAIDKILNPEKYLDATSKKQTFFEAFDEFLDKHKISKGRKDGFMVIVRALKRFELYVSIESKQSFKLTLNELTSDTLHDFDRFLKNESDLFEKYPSIYDAVPESRTPQPRGQNTISGIFSRIRTFVLWCIDQDKTTNNPFRKFNIPIARYGTPYYITIEERNALFNFDLSHRPQLAIQRDVFVFQCLIGCRVGDLLKMTKGNIMNGAIEYIPRKTKEGNPITVRVPINSIANEIIKRYSEIESDKLLPFISEQRYNDAIKEAFTLAGLTRIVTIRNSTTGDEDKQPLNIIASSHLARRTLIGNLYKQVKDPNLISSISGHIEGSKAFARYKDTDEEMKIDLMKLLE